MVSKKEQAKEFIIKAKRHLEDEFEHKYYADALRVPLNRIYAWANGEKRIPQREARLICDAHNRFSDRYGDFYDEEPPTLESLIQDKPIAVRELEEAYRIAAQTNSLALRHLHRAMEDMDYPVPHVI